MNAITNSSKFVLYQVISEPSLEMARQDNDDKEHFTRLKWCLKEMARSVEMLIELVRGMQTNAFTPQVQRATLMATKIRQNLCEENVVPPHIDLKDDNEEELEVEFRPHVRNEV